MRTVMSVVIGLGVGVSTVVLSVALALGQEAPATRAPELYVPNFLDILKPKTVQVLDAASLATLEWISVPPPSHQNGFPQAVAFSADGELAFVTLSEADEVVVIDTVTRTETKRIKVGKKIDPLVFVRPDGQRAYVTGSNGDYYVHVIDIPTLEYIDDIDVPGSGMALGFTPDGKWAYASSGFSRIYRLNLVTNVCEEPYIPTPAPLSGLEVDPTGAIAVGTGGDHTNGGSFIIVVDLATDTVVGELKGEPFQLTQGVEFSRDGKLAYVVDSGPDKRFYVIDVSNPWNPWIASSVQVETAGELWELEVGGNRAYLIAFGYPSEVIAFDISLSPPAQLGPAVEVGNGAFEIGLLRHNPSTPEEAIDEAQELIEEFGLHKGIANSLLTKLDSAQRTLDRDNRNAAATAINKLEAFINEVEAQRGKKIGDAEADRLVEAAQLAIDLIQSG